MSRALSADGAVALELVDSRDGDETEGDRDGDEVSGAAPSAGNLPSALTRLVGRDETLDELAVRLEQTRLLTLCGPGGSGKSRLGLALAERRRNASGGGAWWVELATVSDAALVAQIVATALHPGEVAGAPSVDVIARSLGGPDTILVLDNCEHVIDASAELVSGVLAACPDLRVITTSRQPFELPGEHVWRVEGLGLPPALRLGTRADLAEAVKAPAVQLFAERAVAVAPAFSLGEANIEAVVRICWQLDGMPLALELAAARTAVLHPSDIADRIDRGSSVLRQSNRAVPERQRTLTAALDWSYHALTPAEQTLLRRLSAFAGSFSLPAVEEVCDQAPLETDDVLDLVASLVTQSLVQVVERDDGTRYRLLEIVRQYAAERLQESGEAGVVRDRHHDFFLRLAQRAQGGLAGEQAQSIAELELEHDNLHAALAWRLPRDPAEGGRLIGLLWPFWYLRGYYQEARLWLEQALALAETMAPDVRVEVLTGGGVLAFLQCEYELAAERLEAALALRRELGDRRGIALVTQRLGVDRPRTGALRRTRAPCTPRRWRSSRSSAMTRGWPRRWTTSGSPPGCRATTTARWSCASERWPLRGCWARSVRSRARSSTSAPRGSHAATSARRARPLTWPARCRASSATRRASPGRCTCSASWPGAAASCRSPRACWRKACSCITTSGTAGAPRA